MEGRFSLTNAVVHFAAIPVEIGALPLPRDTLVQSLDMHALTLLCPPPMGPPLSISFRALRCAGGRPTAWNLNVKEC